MLKKYKLQHPIDEAKRIGEEIEADVLNRLSRVNRIFTLNLLRSEGQANGKRFSGQFPDLGSLHWISRKAKKMASEVAGEIHSAGWLQKVFYPPILQSVFEVKGYAAFQSRTLTLNIIIEALRNPMYGMGGVGKSMLFTEIATQANEKMQFAKAIIVAAS